MSRKSFLGEFEQMVLLAVVAGDNDASSLDVSQELERSADRTVSKGALYTTLDRLKKKGLLDWRIEPGDIARSGLPRRHFTVTRSGIAALRESRGALLNLWKSAEGVLGETS